MKTHRSPSRALRSSRVALSIAALALLFATAGRAVVHNVDFGAGCKPVAPDCSVDPCTQISGTVGVMLNDTIQGINTGGGTPSWLFDIEPLGCTGPAPSFTCAGVVINASANPVTVAGIPTTGGSFAFALEGDTGTDLCYEGFELIISDPYDLVMVLDRSGSMSSASFISPPASDRWDALERAVNNFSLDVAGSSCAADSRIALTFFSTNVLPHASLVNLTAIDPPTVANTVRDEMISLRPPGGLTALGLGLQDGIGKLTDPARKRVVMVFSDGQQNQNPRVDPANGTQYTSPAGSVNPGGTGAFKIVTIGIGNPMLEYHDVLSRLGNNNGGTYVVTATGEDITAAMAAATADLLDGCSPQMVAVERGSLAGLVSLAPFDLNRRVAQLTVRLSFSRDFEIPTLAKLMGGVRIDKDGTDVTGFFRPLVVGNFTNTFTLRTDFTNPASTGPATSISPEGTYTVTLAEPPDMGSPLDFEAVVFADDQRLDMTWGVAPAAPRAGGSFEPTLELSWFSAPLTGATVEALILKPGVDLGDALARNPLRVDPSSGVDAGSPGEQKFLQLLGDADFLAQSLPQEQQITLADQGDGRYSGSFSPGDVSGVYQIVYRVSADDPATFGKVQRLATKSVVVRPNVLDLAASAMSATVDGSTIVWKIKPVTVDGRLWGPAQAGSLRIGGAGVNVTDIADDQFGGYTITLSGDPDSEVTVELGDDEIYAGAASGFGPASGVRPVKPTRWLFWLIVLIILVLLIWILMKVFK